jgi:autotransporter-associated beta strand protein
MLIGFQVRHQTARATVVTEPARVSPTDQPNIILIFSDDAGYNEFGFNTAWTGSSSNFLTPSLDTLAAQSIVMFSGYVTSPLCSPSRAGMLTGQYEQRFGYERNTSCGLNSNDALAAGQTLISHYLRDLGYTTGVIGKWHLGSVDGRNRPLDMGFDEFFGTLSGGRNYWGYGNNDNDCNSIRRSISGDEVKIETIWVTEGDSSLYDPTRGRYLTDAFNEEAVDFINNHAGDTNPFFLYLPYTATHVPSQAKQQDLAIFPSLSDPERTFAAMAYAMDRGIGNIMAALQANGIDDSTIVVFVNDNGGPEEQRNIPFRGYKGSTWEGGIRVAYTIMVPGLQPMTLDTPVTTRDLVATLVTAAGGDISTLDLDGVDLMPFLDGSDTSDPHEILFWRYNTNWAVRRGDWKLTRPLYTEPVMLYNLANDREETTDVQSQNPTIAAELLRELTYWEATLDKPHWTVAGDRNRFDHFVYRQDQVPFGAWHMQDIWREADTTNIVTMFNEDAYANAILEFTIHNDGNYSSNNNKARMTGQTFMLNQMRLTGEFTAATDYTGTINGRPLVLVSNLGGQEPRIQLDATSSGTGNSFTFHIDNDMELLHDLEITGDGTQDFIVRGSIRDFYDPRSITKTGTSRLTLTGNITCSGNMVVSGGEVVLQSAVAAIDGATSLEVDTSGAFTFAEGTVAVDVVSISQDGTFGFTGGTLKTSSVLGNLVNNGGTFAPGDSTALTTITGDYTQSAGTLEIEIEGLIAGDEFDQLQIIGDLSAGGVLQVDLGENYVPQIGQIFQIVMADYVDGTFQFDSPVDSSDNDIFAIRYNTNSIELEVVNDVTDVPGSSAVPVVTLLEQNTPNPFNPSTVIRFSIAKPGWVGLVVYNVVGSPIRVLVNGVRYADRYEVTWDGKDDNGGDVASGVYMYVLDAPGYSETKKMVLLK